MRMSAKSRGFTLFELVMTMVILGVLAAVALPKFIDMSGEAKIAATQGIAAAISAGTLANHALNKVADPTVYNPARVSMQGGNACTNMALEQFVRGGIPADYVVKGSGPTGSVFGDCTAAKGATTVTCTLNSLSAGYRTDIIVYCAR